MDLQILGFFLVAISIWLGTERVISRLDKLEASVRRPRNPDGSDKLLQRLNQIELEIVDWRLAFDRNDSVSADDIFGDLVGPQSKKAE